MNKQKVQLRSIRQQSVTFGVGILVTATLFAAALRHSSGSAANAIPPPVLTPQETTTAEAFQKAGKEGDVSQEGTMIQALAQHPPEYIAVSAMHSLAVLGAMDAVPVLDEYTSKDLTNVYGSAAPYIAADAKVAKARLLAEDAAQNASASVSPTDIKTRKFLEVVGLSPNSLNAQVTAYFQHGTEETNTPAPLALKAMRELADIAYQDSAKNFTALPAVNGVNFSLDYISGLKTKIAPLSSAERSTWLIQDIAKPQQLTAGGSLPQGKIEEDRLAAAEGLPAANAAAALLHTMSVNQGQYSEVAFSRLFYVLAEAGDKKQDVLLLSFSKNPNSAIVQQAFIYRQRLNARNQKTY